jgi:PKD repeat protein
MSRARLFFLCVIFHCQIVSFGQCPIVNTITSPPTVCKGQNFSVSSQSAIGLEYQWDFCPGDLSQQLSTAATITGGVVSSPFHIEFVVDGNINRGFVANGAAGNLLRLDYVNGLDQAPVISIVNFVNAPPFNDIRSIRFIKEGSNWFGLMSDLLQKKIFRLNFGTSLLSSPTVDVIDVSSLNLALDLSIQKEGNDYFVLILNYGDNSISRLKFPSSISSVPEVLTSISVPSGNPISLSVKRVCSSWIGFVALNGTGNICRVDFGNSISNNSPTTKLYGGFSGVRGISFEEDAEGYFVFASRDNGSIYRLNFAFDPQSDPISTSAPENILANTSTAWDIELKKDGSNWHLFFLDYGKSAINHFKFDSPCDASAITSNLRQPDLINYSSSGVKLILLSLNDQNGNHTIVSGQVTVSTNVSPNASVVSANSGCTSNAVQFDAQPDNNVVQYAWDFGDANSDNGVNVTHQFSQPGEYLVSLSETAANGCTNESTKLIEIYDPPMADFDLPSSSYCTNNQITILNQTDFDNTTNPSWRWFVDDVEVSTSEDLTTIFHDTSAKNIKLISSFGGCSSEVIKPLTSIFDGPIVDFYYSNNCFAKPVLFTDRSLGSGITTLAWSFGDGSLASSGSPQHQYSLTGSYNVKLVVNNDKGCSNEKALLLKVDDHPLPDFIHSTAIENIPVTFTGQDVTSDDDEVLQWEWKFSSTEKYNTQTTSFTFPGSGNKQVTLNVHTQQGCDYSVSKQIIVEASLSPTISTSFSQSVCKKENIYLQNNTANAVSYSWDLCAEDIKGVPKIESLISVDGSLQPEGVTVVSEDGEFFVFITSRENNKIFRLDFGNSLDNPVSIVSELTGISDKVSGPKGMVFGKQDGIWYAIVGNLFSSLTRLTFDQGLKDTTPQALVLPNLGQWNITTGMQLIKESNRWYLLVNTFDNRLSVVDFGNSLASVPTQNDFKVLVTSIASPYGISVRKEGINWYGVSSSYSDGKLYLLKFGSSLLNIPEVSTVIDFTAVTELSFIKEGDVSWIVALTSSGQIVRISLGRDLENISVSTLPIASDATLANTFSFSLVRTPTQWRGFGINNSSKKLHRITFSKNCDYVSLQHSTLQEPVVQFFTEGVYAIELTAQHSNGQTATEVKTVTVSFNESPSVALTIDENRCLSSPNNFAAFGQGIATYSWSFGDGGSDNNNVANVVHQFTIVGKKIVELSIAAQNGCENRVIKTIDIYNPPSASFTLPSNPHCTNQLYTFNNTSSFDVGSNPSWQWFVDNQEVATDKDLEFAFTNTADASVKLVASIPGCSSTLTQPMTSLVAGPVVDFNFLGKCDQEEIQFTSNISEPVTSLSWSFGDGNTNANDNPKNLYASPGQYSVVLSTTSPSGCNNSKTKTVTIFNNPKPDFSTGGSPNSCTSAVTKFTNQTPALSDSEVSSWLWSFNPGPSGTSTIENPSYQFSVAGDYNVSLKATTKEGCVGAAQKVVSIYQGPSAIVSNTPSCVGIPVTFAAAGNGLDSFYWEMGSSYYTTSSPTHTFNLPGTYTAKLTITAANNCQAILSKPVIVPAVLAPDFSVKQNCVGYDTQLTDLTAGNDPVVQRDWQILGFPSKIGSPVSYNFSSAIPRSVKLTVKSQAGCFYSKTKTINVVAAPVASFDVDPQSGGVPLISQFTNTSINATDFVWKFGDEKNESTSNSPSFTFTTIGEYSVELTASNTEGCESKTSKIISALAAIDDLEIKVINYTTNPDGSLKVIVTLQNNGNTILRNLPVDIDVSGITTLREIVPGPITPSTLYNLVLGSTFTIPEKLSFFCASSTLTNDVTPENNRVCKELAERISLLDSYPNPVKSSLFVSWIAPENEAVTVEVIDLFGKTILSISLNSEEGFNEYVWDAEHVENGLYILKIKSKSVSKTERILIAR